MGEPAPDDDVLEGEVIEPSAAAQDRASKSKPGSSKRRGSPKGSSIPGKFAAKFVPGGGRLTEPLSPAEARRFIQVLDTAIAGLAQSPYEVDPKDPRVEASGDALADISKWLPIVRIAPRVAAPLILVGSQAKIISDILDAAPPEVWWRRRFGRQPGWQPEVVQGYEQQAV